MKDTEKIMTEMQTYAVGFKKVGRDIQMWICSRASLDK